MLGYSFSTKDIESGEEPTASGLLLIGYTGLWHTISEYIIRLLGTNGIIERHSVSDNYILQSTLGCIEVSGATQLAKQCFIDTATCILLRK